MKLVGCKWEPGKDIQLTNGVSCSEMKQTIRNTSMDIIKDEVSAETRHDDTSRGLVFFGFFCFTVGTSSKVASVRASLFADPFPLPRHFPHVVGPVIQCLALRAIHLPPASRRCRSPGETRWSIKKKKVPHMVKSGGSEAAECLLWG